MQFTRVFLIVLDGVGVGGAPDAADFGDSGSNTLGHVAALGRLDCPTLAGLGLGNLFNGGLPGIPASPKPLGLHTRLTEVSAGKDTTTGHWELMGLPRTEPSPTFPKGFPAELIDELSAVTGYTFIGNEVASGTEIIQRLGPAHLNTGSPILYTSADSVLQLAAHVDTVSLEELYRICRAAREVCKGPYAVDRVIARPFSGSATAGFTRTPDRKDFSLAPPGETALDCLRKAGRDVIAVGKIGDIFASRGITRSLPVHGNEQVMDQLRWHVSAESRWHGLLFANLVDFDMLFGHRNDPAGFAGALNDFDTWLAGFLPQLSASDLLAITADHGNDPTTASTDHSREQVPLMLYSPAISVGGAIAGHGPGFFHVGKTVSAVLSVDAALPGVNVLAR
jgi:phosphopentomutase